MLFPVAFAIQKTLQRTGCVIDTVNNFLSMLKKLKSMNYVKYGLLANKELLVDNFVDAWRNVGEHGRVRS